MTNLDLAADPSVEARYQNERQYFDAIGERHGAEIATKIIDESLIPPNMAKYVEVLSRFVQAHGNPQDLHFLDLGCGYGIMSVLLARRGVRVTALDLSPKLVEVTKRLCERNGVADRVEARVGSAEQIELADQSVDAVAGTKILHHVNVGVTSREVYRILKPGGIGVFWEPTYKNPLFDFMNRLTRAIPNFPIAGTRYEHALSRGEIATMGEIFGGVQLYPGPFAFFSHFAIVATRGNGGPLVDRCEKIDGVIDRIFPFLRRFSFHQIIEVKRHAR
ncbi:MAG: class I SAM-dependent methyltransferase [bacterium]